MVLHRVAPYLLFWSPPPVILAIPLLWHSAGLIQDSGKCWEGGSWHQNRFLLGLIHMDTPICTLMQRAVFVHMGCTGGPCHGMHRWPVPWKAKVFTYSPTQWIECYPPVNALLLHTAFPATILPCNVIGSPPFFSRVRQAPDDVCSSTLQLLCTSDPEASWDMLWG